MRKHKVRTEKQKERRRELNAINYQIKGWRTYIPKPKPVITLPKVSILELREWEIDNG